MADVTKSPVSPLQTCSNGSPASHVALVQTVKQRLEEALAVPEASSLAAENKTKELCKYYGTLIPADKLVFLKALATDYSVNQGTVIQLANQLAAVQERGPAVLLRSEERLRHALTPRYQHLFTQISRLDDGVKFLVDLRTDILNALVASGVDHDNPFLHAMTSCLRDLISLWFSVGFLHLQRITWHSACDMLQKISEYEAVHPIRNWTDLKRRVGPYRRCFVFTHNSMPGEPVVVLHTALTNEISTTIQSIVTKNGHVNASVDNIPNERAEDPSFITTAIFYSITSTQRGLQGVELGNYLIKSVVQELLREYPHMHQFSSLSPIPGFKEWFIGEITKFVHKQDCGEDPRQHLLLESEIGPLEDGLGSRGRLMYDSLRKSLQQNSWTDQEPLAQALKDPLLRNCARYLYIEKRRGHALNPVANFHLRNGAVMWRLNWLADCTPRGLGASCGLMVNYRYFLDQTEDNSRTYMEDHDIVAAQSILDLVARIPAAGQNGSASS